MQTVEGVGDRATVLAAGHSPSRDRGVSESMPVQFSGTPARPAEDGGGSPTAQIIGSTKTHGLAMQNLPASQANQSEQA